MGKKIVINAIAILVFFYQNTTAAIQADSMSINLATTNGYKLNLLNRDNYSCFEGMRFGVFPFHGLYGVMNNSVVGMDYSRNGQLVELALPDSIEIEEFVFLKESSVFKSGKILFSLNKELQLQKRYFDTDTFSIALHTDSTLLLYYKGSVFDYNPITDNIERLICLGNYRIINCSYTNIDKFFVVTEHYVAMKRNGTLYPLAKLPEKIVTADLSPQGFFIGTETGLYELTERGDMYKLLETPISQILDDFEVTYIITNKGEIFSCSSSD